MIGDDFREVWRLYRKELVEIAVFSVAGGIVAAVVTSALLLIFRECCWLS